jgi:hypothetical protein
LENGLWDSSALFSPEELERTLVLADCPDWEEKEDEAGLLQAVRRESSEGFR